MKPESTTDDRSPNDVMMVCLEDFGKSEPRAVLVIYVNDDGDLCTSSSSASLSLKIGMLEMAKDLMLHRARGMDSED